MIWITPNPWKNNNVKKLQGFGVDLISYGKNFNTQNLH